MSNEKKTAQIRELIERFAYAPDDGPSRKVKAGDAPAAIMKLFEGAPIPVAPQVVAGEKATIQEVLGAYESWPLVDVLRKLTGATKHLMHDHSCDQHGWEEVNGCIHRGERYIRLLESYRVPPLQETGKSLEECKQIIANEYGYDWNVLIDRFVLGSEFDELEKSFDKVAELYASQRKPQQEIKDESQAEAFLKSLSPNERVGFVADLKQDMRVYRFVVDVMCRFANTPLPTPPKH